MRALIISSSSRVPIHLFATPFFSDVTCRNRPLLHHLLHLSFSDTLSPPHTLSPVMDKMGNGEEEKEESVLCTWPVRRRIVLGAHLQRRVLGRSWERERRERDIERGKLGVFCLFYWKNFYFRKSNFFQNYFRRIIRKFWRLKKIWKFWNWFFFWFFFQKSKSFWISYKIQVSNFFCIKKFFFG